MKKPTLKEGLLLIVFILFIPVVYTLQSFTEEETPEDFVSKFQEDYSIYALELPDTLYFAGERVPMEYFDVRESLDRELLVNTYWQSQTILFIKRANRFFPMIEPILKKYNVPDDFKYLAVAESGLMNVVSPSKATGMWQFLEGTARDYGLEVNTEVDERYHYEKSTEAAAKYLIKNYEKYQSWTLVAASYNAGRTGIARQVNRQKEDDYYNLLLNEETARYVFRILAIKMILENPQQYGFNVRESDMYPVIKTKEIKVSEPVEDFADFAKEHHTNYKILKYFNPWLRENYLSNRQGKEYTIVVPRKNARIVK